MSDNVNNDPSWYNNFLSCINEDVIHHLRSMEHLPLPDNIGITLGDIYRIHPRVLEGCGWLTGDVIDKYLHLICSAFEDFVTMSTYVATAISEGNTTQRTLANTFPGVSLNRLRANEHLLPVNVKGIHWILLVYTPKNNKLRIFDSLSLVATRDDSYMDLVNNISRWYLDQNITAEPIKPYAGDHPVEGNGGRHCGVFVLMKATQLACGAKIQFTYDQYRARVLCELLTGELIPLDQQLTVHHLHRLVQCLQNIKKQLNLPFHLSKKDAEQEPQVLPSDVLEVQLVESDEAEASCEEQLKLLEEEAEQLELSGSADRSARLKRVAERIKIALSKIKTESTQLPASSTSCRSYSVDSVMFNEDTESETSFQLVDDQPIDLSKKEKTPKTHEKVTSTPSPVESPIKWVNYPQETKAERFFGRSRFKVPLVQWTDPAFQLERRREIELFDHPDPNGKPKRRSLTTEQREEMKKIAFSYLKSKKLIPRGSEFSKDFIFTPALKDAFSKHTYQKEMIGTWRLSPGSLATPTNQWICRLCGQTLTTPEKAEYHLIVSSYDDVFRKTDKLSHPRIPYWRFKRRQMLTLYVQAPPEQADPLTLAQQKITAYIKVKANSRKTSSSSDTPGL